MIKSFNDVSERSKFWFILIILWFGFFFYIPYVHGQPINFTLDFEEGDLRGWGWTDDDNNAFYYQPTLGDNPTARHRGQSSNHQGEYWIGTYEKYQGRNWQNIGGIQGDEPQGTLTSQCFTIPQGALSFLIGGGSSFETRVELVIIDVVEQQEGRVYYASGRNTETMHRVTWDLTQYAGKTGMIRIVDASSEGWGHINVDDFRFVEPTPTVPTPTPPTPGITPTPPPPPPPNVEYRIFLEAEPDQLEAGQTVIFSSILEPYTERAEYRFIFGDGIVRDWSDEPIVEHIYSEPGDYHAYVVARLDQSIISESDRVTIYVEHSPPNILWKIIIIGVLAVVGGYYLFSRIKRPEKTIKDIPPEIQIRPHKDIGTQQIESDIPVQSDFEICLRPILDPGKQDIEAEGSLIIDERRERSYDE